MAIVNRWIVLTVVLLGLTGCAADGTRQTSLQRPNLLHPGTTMQQRYNAVAHDPYPDQDAGPEIVGGRPREFQKPLAEPVRNRWLSDSWWAK